MADAGPLTLPAGAGLKLGHSCHKHLIWECELSDKKVAAVLPDRLSSRGYHEQSRSALVRELVHPQEHSVVVVPRTGRVQIRVHYLTPLGLRALRAREIALEIAACTSG